MRDDLTAAELAMISSFRQNMPAIFGLVPVRQERANSRTIRAEVLREQLFQSPDIASGALRVSGATIVDVLDLTGVTVPIALFLENCDIEETVQLRDAEIPRLNLRSSHLRGGLRADGLVVKNSVNARRACFEKAVYLRDAHIGGELNLVGAKLRAKEGSALVAEGVQVDGDLLLSEGFDAEGNADGVIRLLGARIARDLTCDGARIRNTAGQPALHAERVNVGGNVFMRDAELIGTVVLLGASVQGRLSCERADLTGRDGPALMADGLRTDSDVDLTGLTASGSGRRAAVCLRGARTGALICDPGAGPHRRGVTADADGDSLDLMLAKLGSLLTLSPYFSVQGRVLLNGLEYPAVPEGMEREDWTNFLRDHVEYATQPYQQLAGAYRAAGREEDARAVLIAQRDHLLRRPNLSLPERTRLRILRVTLGYGYQSWRAMVGLALTLAFAVTFVLAAGLFSHEVRVPQSKQSCAIVDEVGLGVQLAVPFLSTTNRSRCDLVTSKTSDAWVVAGTWVFQLLGWGFATLFIAGFSGLIRKG